MFDDYDNYEESFMKDEEEEEEESGDSPYYNPIDVKKNIPPQNPSQPAGRNQEPLKLT
jgi:hypothetical protein